MPRRAAARSTIVRVALNQTIEGKLPFSVSTELPRPPHIRYAPMALWTAWLVSATALVTNQFVFGGSGIGPGWSLGMASLAVQAVVFALIARASLVARAIVVAFLITVTCHPLCEH